MGQAAIRCLGDEDEAGGKPNHPENDHPIGPFASLSAVSATVQAAGDWKAAAPS